MKSKISVYDNDTIVVSGTSYYLWVMDYYKVVLLPLHTFHGFSLCSIWKFGESLNIKLQYWQKKNQRQKLLFAQQSKLKSRKKLELLFKEFSAEVQNIWDERNKVRQEEVRWRVLQKV